jgi:hypothetical protein
LSNKAIIAIAAAVIAIGFGATALLPYILTRPAVDPAQTGTLPAFIPPLEIEQFAPIEPAAVPAPAQPPAVAPSAPALRDTLPVEKSAPAVDRTGSVPPAQQAVGRALEAEARASGAEKATAPSRITLTPAEQAAIDRGLKALENSARPRPAGNGLALTEAERAAVERGLRELEKRGSR